MIFRMLLWQSLAYLKQGWQFDDMVGYITHTPLSLSECVGIKCLG
jgi:hypothetical protein